MFELQIENAALQDKLAQQQARIEALEAELSSARRYIADRVTHLEQALAAERERAEKAEALRSPLWEQYISMGVELQAEREKSARERIRSQDARRRTFADYLGTTAAAAEFTYTRHYTAALTADGTT